MITVMRLDPRPSHAALSGALALAACADAGYKEPAATTHAMSTPLRADDQWARIRLYVDAHGYPTKCVITATNITDAEMRLRVCLGFTNEVRVTPILKDGRPVAGSVERMFIQPGPTTRRLMRDEAKARD